MATINRPTKLEVCVDTVPSALAATEGGAARIELCSALSEGGLTPSIGMLKVLKNVINIPIYCMLRPRKGNDFMYSQLEMEALLEDMEILLDNGADGFVFGALTPDLVVDVAKCQQVMERSQGLPVTFHRAFDVTNPVAMHETVQIIKELGFRRILSSGFRQTAYEGREFLAQLIAAHHRDITIMPAAGINVANLEDILTTTKCIEFHASAKFDAGPYGDNSIMECDVQIGAKGQEILKHTDINVVIKMVTIAKALRHT